MKQTVIIATNEKHCSRPRMTLALHSNLHSSELGSSKRYLMYFDKTVEDRVINTFGSKAKHLFCSRCFSYSKVSHMPILLVIAIIHNINIVVIQRKHFEGEEGGYNEQWRDYIQFDRLRLLPIRRKETPTRLHKRANTVHVLFLINHWLLGQLLTQQNKISIKSNDDVPTRGHSR